MKSNKLWKESRPSQDNTHHVVNSNPLYQRKFHAGIRFVIIYIYSFLMLVLPFHAPGYAPVVDETGAYHINTEGNPVYPAR